MKFFLSARIALAATGLMVCCHAAPAAAQTQNRTEDEYVRYDLLDPNAGLVRMTYELMVVTPGLRAYTDATSAGTSLQEVSAVDLMTGAPLACTQAGGRVQVTLARDVPAGGGVRIRIVKTFKDAGYRRNGSSVTFSRRLDARRGAVTLPPHTEVVSADLPVQMFEANGSLSVDFMSLSAAPATLTLGLRSMPSDRPAPGSAPPAAAATTPQAPPDAPPPAIPMERIRVSERASQDRTIVYFLKDPDTHAFSLYHDYTATREGEHQYVNVVRTGSAVSDPSAIILDTGEKLATRILTGADIAREKIDIPGKSRARYPGRPDSVYAGR